MTHAAEKRLSAITSFKAPWPFHFHAMSWDIWDEFGYLTGEVTAWMDQSINGQWDYHATYGVVCFDTEMDVFLFKMRWS